MCTNSIEDIPLSELRESAYSVLSEHLDTLNTRRRDWKGIAIAINLSLKEMNEVEVCNEHCKKLIQIWNTYSPPPQVKDLLEILEEKGCEKAMHKLREAIETDVSSQPKQPKTIRFIASPQTTNEQVCGPSLPPVSARKVDSFDKPGTELSHPISTTPTSPHKERVHSKLDFPTSIVTSALESKISLKLKKIEDGFFVSFHDNDALIGEEIVSEMKSRGINIYSEDDILAGDSVIIKREELFAKSKAVVAVITPDYFSDEGWQLLEGMKGVIASPAGYKRTFIPVICKPTDLPAFVKMRSKIYWSKANKFDQLYNSISSIM